MYQNICKFIFAATLVSNAFSQGTILFANRQPEGFNTFQYLLPDRTGVGAGYTAQLFGGPLGMPIESLQPLSPATTFNPRAPGYIIPVIVSVPGIPAGEQARIASRVFNGPTWEQSTCRAEELIPIVRLGEGHLGGVLNGSGAIVTCIPEPGALAVLFFGSAVIMLRRRSVAPKSSTKSAGIEC